jgi:hypothetical protein
LCSDAANFAVGGADEPVVATELLELASVCEEVANKIEDHLTAMSAFARTADSSWGSRHVRKVPTD